jgi:hypothetical protein
MKQVMPLLALTLLVTAVARALPSLIWSQVAWTGDNFIDVSIACLPWSLFFLLIPFMTGLPCYAVCRLQVNRAHVAWKRAGGAWATRLMIALAGTRLMAVALFTSFWLPVGHLTLMFGAFLALVVGVSFLLPMSLYLSILYLRARRERGRRPAAFLWVTGLMAAGCLLLVAVPVLLGVWQWPGSWSRRPALLTVHARCGARVGAVRSGRDRPGDLPGTKLRGGPAESQLLVRRRWTRAKSGPSGFPVG